MVPELKPHSLNNSKLMRQIQICSDVINNYGGSEDCTSLAKYGFKLYKEEDFVIYEYPKDGYKTLKTLISKEIDKHLDIRITIPTRFTTMNYRGNVIKLDLRNSDDWEIGFLIGLYNMVDVIIKLKGNLFIFNYDKFKDNWCSEILAYLRMNRSNAIQIKEGIIKSWRDTGFEKNITETEVHEDLVFLEKNGMITYCQSDKTFGITSRGFLFR